MFAVARVWWLMVTREGAETPILVPIALLVAIADGVATLAVADISAGYVAFLIIAALTTALSLPIFVRSPSILDTRLLRLLPLTDTQVVWLRLLFADPARFLACIPVLAWGIVGVARLPLGAGALLAGWLEVAACVVAGLMLAGILEDTLGRIAPTWFLIGAAFLALIAVQILVTFHGVWREMADAPAWIGAVSGRVFAFEPGASAVQRGLDAVGSVGLCALFFYVARRVAARTRRPRAPAAPGPTRQRLIARVAARVASREPAAATAAMAMLYRVYAARLGWALTLVFVVAGFFLPAPAFLIGAFAFWAVFGHNLLGPDQPLDGATRYELACYPLHRVFGMRRRVVVVSVSALVVVVAALAAVTVGWREFTLHVLAFAIALGWYGVAAIGGDRVSQRAPKPIDVRAFMMRNGYVRPIAWVSLLVTGVGVGLVYVLMFNGWRLVSPGTPSAAQGVLALGLSAIVLLAIAGAARVW